jgi:hypothetical protein
MRLETGRIRLVDLPSRLPSRWAGQRASAAHNGRRHRRAALSPALGLP